MQLDAREEIEYENFTAVFSKFTEGAKLTEIHEDKMKFLETSTTTSAVV